MADRKSLFSRFWPPSASRRTSAAAPPTTTSTTSTKRTTRSQTSPTSGPPPRAETKTPSTTKATTTPPRTQPRKGDQPSSASPEPSKSPSDEVQKANQQTTSPSTDSKNEPKTSSPSPSPSSSKPASPSRLSAQSRSPPPQPSSPSHARPTPKRASKPNSPSRVTSRSPKQGKLPASPSKGSPPPTETISTTSLQEPEMKEEVKPDNNVVGEENKNGMDLDSKPEETDNYVALKMVEQLPSDKPLSVITLAGENRGASMQLESDSSKREGPIHIHRSYKLNPDDATTTESSGSMDDQPTEAYVNNNAQGVNNSIVFNSFITEGNPGVHMVVNHLPKEQIQTSFPETQKAEIKMSRAQKLTYHPTVRRRCLRGLLMETSDSDPQNPQRHGCRLACHKGDIDAL